jgi:hypothetical protein
MRVTAMSATSAIFISLASLAAMSALAADDPSLIREQKTVMVNGKPEIWRLQWEAKPTPACSQDDAAVSLTCPCSGTAYGEEAPLALIRIRSDGVTERLELGPLFDNAPVTGTAAKRAALQRWAPIVTAGPDSDLQHMDDQDFAARVEHRPETDVMQLADFAHVGQATQFLLQVGTLPCGKHQMVLVGISTGNPHLHVFWSIEKPDEPLILGSWEWEALRDSAGPVDVIDWHCGDHGSDQQSRIHLSANAGGIHVARTSRDCPDPTKSEAYKEMLKLNELYARKQIPYDEFIKRKMELIKQLPVDPP